MNTVWFLPFGSAVARRFGSLRFLGFFAAAAAAAR
jgi:membrane associated rhomboid family serine protease